MDYQLEFDNSMKQFLFGRTDKELVVDAKIYQILSKIGQSNRNEEKVVLYKNIIRYFPAFATILKSSIEPEVNYFDFIDFLDSFPLREAASVSNDELKRFYKGFISSHFSDKRNKTGFRVTKQVIEARQTKEIKLIDFLTSSILEKGVLSDPVVNYYYSSNNLQEKYKEKYVELNQTLSFFRKRLGQSISDFTLIDDSIGGQQLIAYYNGSKIKLSASSTWTPILKQNSDGLFEVERGSVIQSNIFDEEQIEELEYYINSNALESEFQNFFTRNPNFLKIIGNYNSVHPHPILHQDTGEKGIPDFFLERFDNRFCDICELKRPSAKLVTKTTNNIISFSRALEAGIQQLQTYRDYFDDRANRENFKKLYGLDLFKPKIILVIGRKSSFFSEMDRIKLEESRLKNHMYIKTYDEIIGEAREWNHRISAWK